MILANVPSFGFTQKWPHFVYLINLYSIIFYNGFSLINRNLFHIGCNNICVMQRLALVLAVIVHLS